MGYFHVTFTDKIIRMYRYESLDYRALGRGFTSGLV